MIRWTLTLTGGLVWGVAAASAWAFILAEAPPWLARQTAPGWALAVAALAAGLLGWALGNRLFRHPRWPAAPSPPPRPHAPTRPPGR